jgi:hypothetical protein
VQCGTDSYVCGFNTRFLSDQGKLLEDSALNGIYIRCCNYRNRPSIITTNMLVEAGDFGSWKSSYVQCPTGYYAHGYKTRFQDRLGPDDDTALNGLRVTCRKFTLTYPTAAPTPVPTLAPTLQYGVMPIFPTVQVFVPRQSFCLPDHCPPELGSCEFGQQCIYKNGYNGMQTIAKAFATNSGCSLASPNSCDGAISSVVKVSTIVPDMITKLKNKLGGTQLSSCTPTPAGVNPSLFGDNYEHAFPRTRYQSCEWNVLQDYGCSRENRLSRNCRSLFWVLYL